MDIENLFSSNIILENEFLVLQPLLKEHIDIIESISYTNELGEFGKRVKNRSDLEYYFEFCINSIENKEFYPFIILRKFDKAPLGITMFGNISFPHKRLEIGWTWLGVDYQGVGINAQCKKLLLNYCFENLEMRRVEFKVDIKNIKSQKAVEKLGAVKEGLLRNYNIQSYGESDGTYVYSILKNEWSKIDKLKIN